MRVPRRDNGVAKALGKRIRSLRTSNGWSQERLATESGMHRTYIWGIERGTRNPSLRHLARLASALSITLQTLFKDVTYPYAGTDSETGSNSQASVRGSDRRRSR